jgi:hypothetical protein
MVVIRQALRRLYGLDIEPCLVPRIRCHLHFLSTVVNPLGGRGLSLEVK